MTDGKLPVISGKRMVKLLESCGFRMDRQKGSHFTLANGDIEVTVPVHQNRDLKKKTMLSILKTAGISREEFLRALRK